MSLYNNQREIKPQNKNFTFILVNIFCKVLEFVKLEDIKIINRHRENFYEKKISNHSSCYMEQKTKSYYD